MYNLIGSGKPQWTVLRHNGPMFPPPYEPHGIPVLLNGVKINLSPEVEEYVTIFSRYIDSPYMENQIFIKNFSNDFKNILPPQLKNYKLEEFDFTLIKNHIKEKSEKLKNLSKEEKEKIKAKNDELDEPFKTCIIDGGQQKVGNFKIEPPGIYLGRGKHPKSGKIKRRIYPNDVTINLDKQAPTPVPFHSTTDEKLNKWGKIIHDRSVIWLASWKDTITGKRKYIFTSMDSIFKSKSDLSKFDLAKKLKRKVNSIRKSYETDLESRDVRKKQLATALYFIDKLALRVGGAKDKKEEADTVGVTSLRIEHINLLPENVVKLDFLAKDSIRYCQKIRVIPIVYNNLEMFTKKNYESDSESDTETDSQSESDSESESETESDSESSNDRYNKKQKLFDLISANSLNQYLETFMKGLTAKVWRTFNASYLFQKELDKVNLEKMSFVNDNEKTNYLQLMFNQANSAVAILCNHQKNVSSDIDKKINQIDEKIKELQKKKRKIQDKKGRTSGKETKGDKINKINNKIKLLKLKKNSKSASKNVSLGTSKLNYIDPRIVISFSKKFEIPLEKLFSKTEINRFEWAKNVDKNYRF
tara:strand:+ start:847 stop:2607 length:1761 start_codon:yes stop_codon:yes gene_type:complete